MKIGSVSSLVLGSLCWHGRRGAGACHTCSTIRICPLPEAKKGRVRVLEKVVAYRRSKLEQAERRLAAARKEVS